MRQKAYEGPMEPRENPKHKTGDGAGFGRLRAEQAKRAAFLHLIRRSHPSGEVHIDKIHEYAGVQVAFYRVKTHAFEHARVAVFRNENDAWVKDNDIIVAQA